MTYILREILCGHSADIGPTLCGHISPGIYVRTMSTLYPSSVFSSGKDFAKMSEDPDPLNGLRGLGKFKGYFNHLFKNFKNK